MKLSMLAAMLLALLGSGLYIENAVADNERDDKGWHEQHNWKARGLGDARKPPIWSIFKDGTAKSVKWQIHKPNPRFAIYNNGTRYDVTDDLVWDLETGYVWERVPSQGVGAWDRAGRTCRFLKKGGRFGFRLPTIEELSTLIDPDESQPALPSGHPFEINIGRYWTSTTDTLDFPIRAFIVNFLSPPGGDQIPTTIEKSFSGGLIWCVRGGVQKDIGVNIFP